MCFKRNKQRLGRQGSRIDILWVKVAVLTNNNLKIAI